MNNSQYTRGMAIPSLIAIIAVILIGGGLWYANTTENEEMMNEKAGDMMEKGDAMKKEGETMIEKGDSMMKEGEAMMEDKDGAMMEKDGAMMVKYTGTILAGKSAPLLDYNKADYDTAIASDKLVVLYFYANWCPICKEEVANALIPAFNELTTDKVVGIRINYKDSDTDSDEKSLAVKYGIPYQHTKVFIKNGKQLLKAPDGWNKGRYITEIQKAITQ